jgi:hypothetical protein
MKHGTGVIIGLLEAIGCLPDGDTIKTMRAPGTQVIQMDVPREDVIAALRAAPEIRVGAYAGASAMGYNLS